MKRSAAPDPINFTNAKFPIRNIKEKTPNAARKYFVNPSAKANEAVAANSTVRNVRIAKIKCVGLTVLGNNPTPAVPKP